MKKKSSLEEKYKTVVSIIDEQIDDVGKKNSKLDEVTLFVKIGILVLSIMIIVGLGIRLIPGAVTVSSIGRKRDLPIYCVDTEENKISLSFDAAW